MTGLAAPGTRAVLVGTGTHAPGSALPALPAVDATVDDLARALRDVCGLPEDHIRRVPADATAADVIEAVQQAVAEATGTVLFSYTGHGILGPGDELYLATRGTLGEDRIAPCVPYRVVKDALGGATGGSVVVLDCCFSGRAAVPGAGGPRGVFDSALPDGSFLLTSASGFAVSYAPDGERHTLFGGKLLRLLEDGDPSGPPLLTLDDVHTFLDRAFRDGTVHPQRRSEGTLGGLVVAPNRAYRRQRPAAALPPADVPCPYPGMEPFRAEDHAHFFGREQLTEELLDAVSGPGADGRPLVLVGASGAGKSSLLRAGLLAGLDRRHGAGRPGTPWPAVLLPAPGPHPLRALAERWARATGHPPDEVHGRLLSGAGLPAPRPGSTVCRLLVVDQFEETFTRCTDPEERTRFIRSLCAPGGDPAAHPRVVLGLRADHYGSCLAHPELAEALEHRQRTVRPMDEQALRAAVERPALAVGLALEDGLTDRLLADLAQDTDEERPTDAPAEATALPFLAHALRETWLRRSGAVLTLAGYQATGGIRQSVATTTEALYQELDAPARTALRELLLRMVELSGNGEFVRRRVELSDLLAGRPDDEQQLVTGVWDRLADARLVTVDKGGAQIAHEALLRAWPRLRSWIREAQTELLARQQLSEAAAAWEEHGRDPGYLYTGSRLETVRPWLTGTTAGQPGAGIGLTTAERAFAEAGLRAARRTRRRRLAVTALAVCLALLLTAAGTVAFLERDRSQQRAANLTSERIAAQAEALRPQDPSAALDLSLAAYRTAPTVEARTSLLQSATAPVALTLSGHTGKVLNLAFHKDGRVLASSAADGTLRLWDFADRYHPVPGAVLHTGRPVAVAWRPDGRYLAASSRDTFFLWDTSDPLHPRQVARLATDGTRISALAFSPDGRTVAVSGDHVRIHLWDVRDPARPASTVVHIAEDQAVVAEAYSPDGHVLATALDDDTMRLWDTGRAGGLTPLATVKDAALLSLAFRPDGQMLAGGGSHTGRSDNLWAWDVKDPSRPRALNKPTAYSTSGAYTGLVWRPDGQFVAASTVGDKSVHTFTFRSGTGSAPGTDLDWSAGVLVGGSTRSLAYFPDGRGLVAGDEDNGDIAVRQPPPRAVTGGVADRGYVAGSAFDESAHHVVTGGEANNKQPVRIWDVSAPGRAPKPTAELPPPWVRARFLTDGRMLLSRNTDGTRLKLWQVDGGRLRPGYEFRLSGGAVQGSDPEVYAVSDDGALFALRGASESTMGLWDIRDIEHPRRVGEVPWPRDDGSTTPSFPGRRVLALMTSHGTQTWDVRDPRRPRRGDVVKETPWSTISDDGDGTGPRLVVGRVPSRGRPGRQETHVWSLTADGTARRIVNVDKDVSATELISRNALAVLSEEGRPTVWDLRRPGRGVPLPGPVPKVQYMYASRARHLVAAWENEGLLALWNVSDPNGSRPGGDDELLVLSDLTRKMRIKDMSPAGDLVMSPESTGQLVPLGVDSLVVSTDFTALSRTLCSIRSTRVPEKQWKELLPGVKRQDPCP
ncbi:caspase, EACC1-associated type [Streptomyces morookaense]|uniref:Caspase family protein n=1 Tax=Streptomyces morookaense TaxID=1970 RepID=A0A7Y7AZG2_STRMO|nr:caspase family protein [Streptomyces morookaense]NVK76208.1 caspase family protein [Streptomyces morookaense]GHF38169.1 hypothetical protein GCM10010359_46100 [Streptomyces morookaense]